MRREETATKFVWSTHRALPERYISQVVLSEAVDHKMALNRYSHMSRLPPPVGVFNRGKRVNTYNLNPLVLLFRSSFDYAYNHHVARHYNLPPTCGQT